MNSNKAYKILQDASGFRIGDKVRLVGRFIVQPSYMNSYGWTAYMDRFIDKTGYITDEYVDGLAVRFDAFNEFLCPFWSLEKVESGDVFDPSYRPEPFQKVLCRDNDNDPWIAGIFSCYYERGEWPYVCICTAYKQCIPYEGNEELVAKEI
jgi:hypothetical protein